MSGCAFVEPRLRPLIDGELTAADQRRVLGHLDGCSRCRDSFARAQAVVALVQEQQLDEVPPHFSAGLQVRLARHRTAREQGHRRGPLRLPRLPFFPGRWRWAGAATAAVMLILCVVGLQGKSAAEVVREAEQSWKQIRNYGCEFVSEGYYQGQPRIFRQKQFCRRGLGTSEFTLETSQDYPLTTYVKPDRVIHYIPGGHWRGRPAPLVIVRPRREAQDALPFPFGVTWNSGGNVSLDQLVRQLSQNNNVRLLGTDRVGEHDCFRLQFSAVPPGGTTQDQYELWIDKATFLPRRVSWYRDEANHIVTTAEFLQVNYLVLPAGTFDEPRGGVVFHGDVDPHVLALPVQPRVAPELLADPVAGARYESWARSSDLPFTAFSPDWLPEDYRLIRVRRARSGHWLDAHWVRTSRSGLLQVLQLEQRPASVEPRADLLSGEEIILAGSGQRRVGRILRGDHPYPFAYLTWAQGGTRFTLFASDLSDADIRRVASSMTPVSPPPAPAVAESRTGRPKVETHGEPSLLPTEVESTAATEPAAAPAPSGYPPSDAAGYALGSPGSPSDGQPPMMPETPDE